MNDLLSTLFDIRTTSPDGKSAALYSVRPSKKGHVCFDSLHVYPEAETIDCANLLPEDARFLGVQLLLAAHAASEAVALPPVAEALYRQAVRQMGEF